MGIKTLFSLFHKDIGIINLIRKIRNKPKNEEKVHCKNCGSTRSLKVTYHYHRSCFDRHIKRKSLTQRNKILKRYNKRAKRRGINLTNSCLFCGEFLGIGGIPEGVVCGECGAITYY